ncbi:MAG: hypothetical protein ACM3XM_04755 [Mycobacterium leprae]
MPGEKPTIPLPPVAPGPIGPIDPGPILRLFPTLPVVRPEDMLALEFRFLNLTTSGASPPQLVRQDPAMEAFLAVRFPPQAIAETAYADSGGTPQAPPITSRAAGESWLVFRVPADVEAINFTLEDLLDWSRLEPVTASDLANPAGNSVSSTPFTAIEAPYRLFLSPGPDTGWVHALRPVTHAGRTELWHTRLAVRRRDGTLCESPALLPMVRAVWTPDLTPPPNPDSNLSANHLPFAPGRSAISRRHRYEIVQLCNSKRVGRLIDARRLMLSTLGAWLDLHGAWDPPETMNVMGWRHIATMGRDHYVKVVEKGYLYPFGHRAALVTETIRRVEPVPGTARQAAYLRQKQYLIVLERERTYPGPEAFTQRVDRKQARNLPLRRITVTTERTPDLDATPGEPVAGLGTLAFWPRSQGADLLFHCRGEDWEGKHCEFALPLLFLKNTVVHSPSDLEKVRQAYRDPDAAANCARRTVGLAGQQVAFARRPLPGTTAEPEGDVNFETEAITFSSTHPASGSGLDRPYFPIMEKARVRIPTLAQFAGTAAAQTIQLADVWLESGFDPLANKGQLLAVLPDRPIMAFAGEKVGGVMRPDLALAGLSLRYGLVGGNGPADAAAFADGLFDPSRFFDGAKVLGGLALAELVDAVSGLTAAGNVRVPQITSRVRYQEEEPLRGPSALETTMVWEPGLHSFGPFVAWYNDDPEATMGTPATLKVNARAVTPLAPPAPPTYTVTGDLTSFTIDLANCIRLGFPRLAFTAGSGASPAVNINLKWVIFTGPLTFVQKLREQIGDLTGDRFNLDVEPSGLKAALSLPVPPVAMGIFSLQNLAFAAGLHLPFMGDDPMLLRLAFSARESPFIATVGPFGGGGFFALELSAAGVRMLEAALEFGGNMSLNIGVASGGLYLMAGIYFSCRSDSGAQLEGYVRCGGELEVLGIVSLSAEFYMGLVYQSAGNKVWGQATLTVEVELLFFSTAVSLTVERCFSGDEHDPSFTAMMTEPAWQEYAAAFAPDEEVR